MALETGSLSELLSRYVQRQAEAQAAGEVFSESAGEIELHDPGLQPLLDVRQAWDEAQTAIRAENGLRPTIFPEWPALLSAQDSFLALPLAAGNTPQLVRNLLPLLHGQLTVRTPGLSRPAPVASLRQWVEQHAPRSAAQRLLAAGLLRLARQHDEAARVLGRTPVAGLESAWLNEEAALAWQQGDTERALAMWENPDLDGFVPALFNRGMASLFLGDSEKARQRLEQVVGLLPENGAWHHLAQLYLTLTSSR